MKDIPRSYLIGGIVVIVLLVVAGFMFSKNKNQSADQSKKSAMEEETEVIPTVDSSVKVTVEAMNAKKDLMLKITGIPNGTESVEYIISYNTAAQGLQGLNGIVSVDSGDSEVEKKLTVGTCSSGSCVYHDVVGDIKVELKFTGSYGDRVFQKEFPFE